MRKTQTTAPQARTQGLIIKHFSDETLVYDTDHDRAHCLNQTAALVWKYCDGQRTVAQIAQQVGADTQTRADERLVWYALEQLGRDELLQTRVPLPAEMAQMSRREFIQQFKVAAAIAVPLIVSITAPTAAQAASCLPSGSACTSSAQCCSGQCNFGTCS